MNKVFIETYDNTDTSTYGGYGDKANAVGSTANLALIGPETGNASNILQLFTITLYADNYAWDGFNTQATSDSNAEYKDNYSAYAMYWYCNLNGTLNATKEESGCCLRDLEDTEGGGYCIRKAGSGDADPYETLQLVEADFVEALDNTNTLPTTPESMTATNKGFSTFKCDEDELTNNNILSCAKLQYWPAASYSEGFRFEKGN